MVFYTIMAMLGGKIVGSKSKRKPKVAASQLISDGRLQLAVIGAGPAGLVSAKHAIMHPDVFNVTVFEQSGRLGGTWVYSEKLLEDDLRPVHSAMYKSLRTNLPKQTMAFLDLPFPPWVPSYPSGKEVLDYLEDYAYRFNVKKLIKFNTRVLYVAPFYSGYRYPGWIIDVENTKTKQITRYIFDAVMLCNGHFYLPRLPNISGIEYFKGFVMHSHSYRVPTPFRSLKVVCLGAGSSGTDISREIASVAQVVYFSHNNIKPIVSAEVPPNLIEINGIASATATGFFTHSGEWYEADALVLCTGYRYAFPFLSNECKLQVTDTYVLPLYKHLININYPTMALLGLPLSISGFPTFDLQARYFIATLTGRVILPSHQQMMAELGQEIRALLRTRKSIQNFHLLGIKQWKYLDELASAVGLAPLPPVVQSIFWQAARRRWIYPYSYKSFEYDVLDYEKFLEWAPIYVPRHNYLKSK